MAKGRAEVDETDIEILRHLEKSGMKHVKRIAEDLEISKSTIYYRIDKLEEKGIIEGIRAELNPVALGLDIVVITNIEVGHEPGYAQEIGERLADIDGVCQVYYTMGDTDFMVVSRLPNRDRVNELIDNIVNVDGVNKTSSTFVMDEIRSGDTVIEKLSPEMVEEIINQATM